MRLVTRPMIVLIPRVTVQVGLTFSRSTKKAETYVPVGPITSNARHLTPLTLTMTTG